MQNNLRGELTNGKGPELQDYDLVDAVARSLHLSTPKELEQLGAVLFPAMVNASVVAGDVNKIDMLKSYGANLSSVNYDMRTALHVACAEGNEEVVRHLLLNGAAVHIRDRYDRSPLAEAINYDYHSIIKLLLKCGSHLTISPRALGDSLCGAAARGIMKRLESYSLAGADLSMPDASGRTGTTNHKTADIRNKFYFFTSIASGSPSRPRAHRRLSSPRRSQLCRGRPWPHAPRLRKERQKSRNYEETRGLDSHFERKL